MTQVSTLTGNTLTKLFVVKITVERCDKFWVAVRKIFDRVKPVALWSAKKKRTIKGYGSAASPQRTTTCGCGVDLTWGRFDWKSVHIDANMDSTSN